MGHFGRARVSSRHPEAAGCCDRCGGVRSRSDLVPQMRYAGMNLVDSGLRVCRVRCLDAPNPQEKARVVPADPMPITDPRPDPARAPVPE